MAHQNSGASQDWTDSCMHKSIHAVFVTLDVAACAHLLPYSTHNLFLEKRYNTTRHSLSTFFYRNPSLIEPNS
ncbi:hypothetical protein J6590_069087 [Homalodisca vitripennis]|nr:hypothetical protein J6590_069087 [Homalodisca vitripennis]